MNVILMHGKDTSPTGKWYPWFIAEVGKLGVACHAPLLPQADDPYLEEWITALAAIKPNEESILVGHSRGGVAILRYLECMPVGTKVRKVILVATNSGRIKPDKIGRDSHDFFSEKGFDFEIIRTHCDDFVVLHSRDDQWVPFTDGEENARGLGVALLAFDAYGHFGKSAPQIPELLAEVKNAL